MLTKNLIKQPDAVRTIRRESMDSLDNKSMRILVIVFLLIQIGFDVATAVTLPDQPNDCLEAVRRDVTWFFYIKVITMIILTILLIMLRIFCCRNCKYFLDITWFICLSFGLLNIFPLIKYFSCGNIPVNAEFKILLTITPILLSLFMALIYFKERPKENASEENCLDYKTMSTLGITFFIILIVFDALITTMPQQLGKCLAVMQEDVVKFSYLKLLGMCSIAIVLIMLRCICCQKCTYFYDIVWLVCTVSGLLNVFPLICYFSCEKFPVDSKSQFALTIACIVLGIFIALIRCCYKKSPNDIESQGAQAPCRTPIRFVQIPLTYGNGLPNLKSFSISNGIV